MKSTLLWVALLFCISWASAQTITGKVYREGTDTVIAGASVYYSGSMGGTITNKLGYFELPARQEQIPIIISCIGYYSATIHHTPGQPLTVYLKPKLEELKTVVIRADGMARDAEIKQFFRDFFGSSEYAKSCVITNLDDIDLFYNKKTKTLTASCDKPIIIQNPKLGYTISYYLDKFESRDGKVFISGNYVFKEDEVLADKPQVKHNRENAYAGSRLQFIRALWHHTLNAAGFSIANMDNQQVTENNIVAHDTLQQKYLHLPNQILVSNENAYYRSSFITTNQDFVFIDQNGFYGEGLQWLGDFDQQRIGDLLPYDYQSEKEPDYQIAQTSVVAAPAAANPAVNRPITENPNVAERLKQLRASISAPEAVKTGFKLFFEKTYLHTDRETYTGGEDIWFKAYLLNGQSNELSNSSNNLYVELISPDDTIIERKVIRLDSGLGNGDFHLSDSVSTGAYRIRAYTSWMRNFGDNFVFEKKITVLNTEAAVTGGEVAAAVAGKPATKTTPTATNTATTTQNPVPNAISFFPEGGSLIEGVAGMVAFKTESDTNMPVSGNILSASGNTVAVFACDSSGMGSFMFNPVPGEKYTAKGAFANGTAFTAALPTALSSGFSLFVQGTDSLFRVSVSTNQATLDQQQGQPLSLIAKSKGKTVYSAQLPLHGLQATVTIPKAGFPAGISAITLYDASDKPQAERLVYVDDGNPVQLTLTSDKRNYAPKEKVIVTIKATDQNKLPVKASLSLAAVDAGLIPVSSENIFSYLNLSSEIKGNIDHPNQYFDTNNSHRKQQLDLLLITQGWRDFIWKRLADSALKVTYPAEQGITVSGKVRETDKDKPLAGVNVTLMASGATGNKLFSAITDSTGHYYLDGVGLYGQQSIRLNARDSKGEAKGMILLDSLFKDAPVVNPLPLAVTRKLATSAAANEKNILERGVAARKVSLTDTTHLKEVQVKASKFIRLHDQTVTSLGYADEVFNIEPKDYDHFDLFHYLQHYSRAQVDDILFSVDGVTGALTPHKLKDTLPILTEYIKLLYYQGRQGNYSFPRLIVNGKELVYDNTPSDMRMMAAYQQTYFSLPVNKVKKVVIKRAIGPPMVTLNNSLYSPTGSTISDGDEVYIIYLTLEPGALVQPVYDKISASVNGYYQARTFYTPQYKTASTKPDYRTTIHWEPNITTDEKGEATVTYYNANPKTKIRIVAEGVSDKGVPVAGTAGYDIK